MATFGFSLIMRGKDAKPDTFVKMAQRSEALGLDAIYCSSHVILPPQVRSGYIGTPGLPYPPHWKDGYWEPMTVLSYLAPQTKNLTLGTSITVLPMHNPIEMAKQIAEVDQLSKGRFVLGLGVGWFAEEFDALGQDFSNRGARMDEALRMMLALWDADPVAFEGKYFQFEESWFSPKPLQQPHPPIWMGGSSPAVLRRTARFADAWHPVRLPYDRLESLWKSLGPMLEEEGRPRDALDLAVKIPIVFQDSPPAEGQYYTQGRPQDMIDAILRMQEIGATHFVLDLVPETRDVALDTMERFAQEVLPKV